MHLWFCYNCLSLNADKAECIRFSILQCSRYLRPVIIFHVTDVPVSLSSAIKTLGVMPVSNLYVLTFILMPLLDMFLSSQILLSHSFRYSGLLNCFPWHCKIWLAENTTYSTRGRVRTSSSRQISEALELLHLLRLHLGTINVNCHIFTTDFKSPPHLWRCDDRCLNHQHPQSLVHVIFVLLLQNFGSLFL